MNPLRRILCLALVAPVAVFGQVTIPWAKITGQPTTAAGYGIANGSTLDAWSAKAPYLGNLIITSGKTVTFSNTLTFTGTDSSSVAFGAGGTVLYNGGALGTPSSGTLTNASGLPIATGVSGLGTGVATFLATPSSANLLGALTDKTGTGANVFATSPTLVTPNIGAATGTSLALTGNISSAGSSALFPAFTTIGTAGQTTLPAATGVGLFFETASTSKRIYFGDGSGYTLYFATRTGSATTDRLTLTDAGNLTLSGSATLGGNVTINGGAASTNTGTGAIVLGGSGGLGLGGNLNVGASANVTGNASVTGNLTVTGVASLNGAGNPIKGTATNDAAATGYIGEYQSANLAQGSAVSLTTTTAANVVSLSLTAGDWDVRGLAAFVAGSGATVVQTSSGLSTTSGALSLSTATTINGGVPAGLTASWPIVATRISVSATTTVYLVSVGYFSGGTLGAYGLISARRVR